MSSVAHAFSSKYGIHRIFFALPPPLFLSVCVHTYTYIFPITILLFCLHGSLKVRVSNGTTSNDASLEIVIIYCSAEGTGRQFNRTFNWNVFRIQIHVKHGRKLML